MSDITPETQTEAQIEQIEEDFEASGTLVGIIMGSQSDMEKMLPARAYLTEQGIDSEIQVMSAHRDPETVREFCTTARARGLKVIIAGAGMNAALPGAAAAHTDLPVIGVPLFGESLGGLDALLSTVQMPPGTPVACVAIDGAENAGVLAARIINA
jgi:phosphoribosylaminoimidazole carboxylase PurE protein